MKKTSLLFAICCLLFAPVAHANWQYPGYYTRDGWAYDDGSRFTISVRGGASMGNAKVKNEVGALSAGYWLDQNTGEIISDLDYQYCVEAYGGCGDFVYAGYGNIGDIPTAKKLSTFAFAAGLSVGLTIPDAPQWRFEAGWDHISETNYNASPLFDGDLYVSGGVDLPVQSGGVSSTLSTDIISVMAFYDFYEGVAKPLREIIPYVGVGIGYGYSTTIMDITDLYGDMSNPLLSDFGEVHDIGFDLWELQFYRSETNTSNIAGLLALGVSYGIAENTFLDFGIRLTYLPKIKWKLSSADGEKQRDWFSADNMIYTNIMAAIRFEF